MVTSTIENVPNQRVLLLRALAYYAGLMVLGFTVAAFGPTLPGLAAQTGSTLKQISIVFTVNSLGYMIGSLLGGVLYGWLPGQFVIAGALVSMALTLVLVPFAPSLILLIAVLIALGVGMGTLDVGGNTLIVWTFGDKVGPYMNALHFSFGLGAFLSPILIDRVVVSTGGIQWAFWGLAVLIIPVAIWLTRLPSPTSSGEMEKQASGATIGGLTLLVTIFAAGLLLLHVGGELGFGGFIYSYGEQAGLGETNARLLNSTYWGALALGRLVSIPLAMRLRPRMFLLLAFIGAAASLLVIIAGAGIETALWAGTFGFGFFIGPIYGSVVNYAERRIAMTSIITSMLLVGGSLGSMTIPWIVGQTFGAVGPHSLMLIVGGTIIASILLLGLAEGVQRLRA